MSEWKCGRCGKEYEFDDFIKLEKVKAVEEDTDPIKQHGFTSKCSCGYIFHIDKWHLVTMIDIVSGYGSGTVKISTVFLELSHSGYWYETMIFNEKGINIHSDFEDRYVTKEEAETGHKKIIELLKNGEYTLKPTEFELTLKT